MSIDEARIQLRPKLEELFGVSGAEILMDQPPGGWGDVVTNHTLDLRFAAFEERSDRKLEALEARIDLRFAGVDARFAAVEHRFDNVDHEFAMVRADMHVMRADLLAEMDRRFRAQAWMTITTIVAIGGVIVAAIRL